MNLNSLVGLLFSALILIGINASAQHPGGNMGGKPGGKMPTNGTITGKIIDHESGEPVEFATVSLFKIKDSTLVTGAISNNQGIFLMEKVPYGMFYLKSTFIGYDAQLVSDIKVTPKAPNVNAGEIKIKVADGALDAVEISTEASLMETRIDKKVFNAEKDMDSKGGSGLDVLRNVPSVDVDEEDNITLRGDKNVNILIDGRPSSISVSQLMKQLPASDISKVEIVTNPSAKYDPEGMSGIINIILKKNKNKGFNGNSNLGFSYGKTPKYNASLMLNYKTDKLNLYTNLSYYNGPHWYSGNTDRTYELNDTLYRMYSENEGIWAGVNYNAKVGADFFVNDKNTLYISGNYNLKEGVSNGDLWNVNRTLEGVMLDSSLRVSTTDSPGDRVNINGGWQTQFKKPGSTFDLDINYDLNNSLSLGEYDEHFYDLTGVDLGSPFVQNVNSTSNSEVLYIRGDYVLPINDSLMLEAGIHSTTRNKMEGIDSETWSYSSEIFEPDTSINNEFEYGQQVYAGYFTLAKEFNQFGIKVGARLEQTDLKSKLINTGEQFDTSYISLFPSAHLSYKMNEGNEFQLSYSRRINRPKMHQLNPFASYSNPYSFHIGNPFLQPEFINVYEAGYIKMAQKFTLNSTIYYRQINDMIRRFLTQEGQVSVVSFQNFSTANVGGAEFILSYRPMKKMRVTGSFNYWASRITDSEQVGENVPSNGWNSKAAVSYGFKNGIQSQVSLRYNGGMLVTQGYILPRYGLNLSLQKSILDKRGTISVRVRDIFNTMNFTFESDETYDLDFQTYHKWESRQFSINFNYFFGKQVQGKQKRRTKSNNSGDNNSIGDMQ